MRNLIVAATVPIALALAGCAKSPFPVIDAKIDALKGQPIKVLIDRLGDPTEQRHQVGAENVYTWALASNFDAYQAVGFACTLKVFVDKNSKVAHYAYEGNFGGCGRYAHRLDSTYHTAQGLIDF